MRKLEKLFFNTPMSMKLVIMLAIVTGIVPGLLMVPDILYGTSFQSPGIQFEFWIFAAMFIILNCEKPLEAGYKTFIFFLISQPIIYLVQVPFNPLGWEIFSYYPSWFVITLLTFPGGMIAWYTKKGSWLSVLILSAANVILCYELPYDVSDMLGKFPRMLITCLFIVFEIIFFICILFKEKKKRIAAFVIAAVLLAGGTALEYRNIYSSEMILTYPAEGRGPYELVSGSDKLNISFDDEDICVSVRRADIQKPGECTVIYKDADGLEHEYHAVYGNGNCNLE